MYFSLLQDISTERFASFENLCFYRQLKPKTTNKANQFINPIKTVFKEHKNVCRCVQCHRSGHQCLCYFRQTGEIMEEQLQRFTAGTWKANLASFQRQKGLPVISLLSSNFFGFDFSLSWSHPSGTKVRIVNFRVFWFSNWLSGT